MYVFLLSDARSINFSFELVFHIFCVVFAANTGLNGFIYWFSLLY